MATVRLQKVLAHAGVASRRAAEELISAGRVRVDGRVVTELGTKVDPRAAKVEVDGTRVVRQGGVYVLLHKPRGVVSTMSDPEGRPTVKDLIGDVAAARAYPVGRLDFNTSGAILITNDGDFSVALMHPSKSVPKTYVLKVQGLMQDTDVDRWRRGVELEDGKTKPAKVKLLRHEGDKTWLELTITEGRNQQVRRMGDATGFRVMRLARMSFAGIGTEDVAPGKWRYLTAEELTTLKKDYGVPKRIVSPPKPESTVKPAPKPRARPVPHDTRSGKGKPARPSRTPHGAPDTSPRYGGGAPARREVGTRDDWGGGIRRGASDQTGPRMGQRSGEASSERGGRGQARDSGPPRGDVGGRGGRTRTTGSGGGIGAAGGNYRIKGRHG